MISVWVGRCHHLRYLCNLYSERAIGSGDKQGVDLICREEGSRMDETDKHTLTRLSSGSTILIIQVPCSWSLMAAAIEDS